MGCEAVLRKQIVSLLESELARVPFDRAVGDLAPPFRGQRVERVPYTIWELVEHLRIAQWDILEFSRNPKHVSPDWPSGYWPKNEGPQDGDEWFRALDMFRADLRDFQDLLRNPSTSLFEPIPHGDGQTILQEAFTLADHNSYHVGQIVLLRRMLGCW